MVADDDVDAALGGASDGGMVSNADVRCDDQSDAVLCRLVCCDGSAVAFDEAVGDVVVRVARQHRGPQGTLEYETGCGAVDVVVRDANALFAPNAASMRAMAVGIPAIR